MSHSLMSLKLLLTPKRRRKKRRRCGVEREGGEVASCTSKIRQLYVYLKNKVLLLYMYSPFHHKSGALISMEGGLGGPTFSPHNPSSIARHVANSSTSPPLLPTTWQPTGKVTPPPTSIVPIGIVTTGCPVMVNGWTNVRVNGQYGVDLVMGAPSSFNVVYLVSKQKRRHPNNKKKERMNHKEAYETQGDQMKC